MAITHGYYSGIEFPRSSGLKSVATARHPSSTSQTQAVELQTTHPRGAKGRWLDALFVCMILISIVGLTYSLIHR